MPEVVYATPDAEGKSRNWDDVFPIWKNEEDKVEWKIVNQILEVIAINNRFGGKTVDELKEYLINDSYRLVQEHLERDGTENLTERNTTFQYYGMTNFYINQIFENLGGAYREYK